MNRWWILLPALGVAAALVLTDDTAPQSESLSAATERPTPAGRSVVPQRAAMNASAAKKVAAPIRPLVSREDLYGPGTASTGKSSLFASRSWTEPVAPVVNKGSMVEEAPPFPYTVAGRKKEGKAWEVFLTRDSEAFVAREGELLESDYKVTKIGSTSMTVVFIRLNHAHEIALGEME